MLADLESMLTTLVDDLVAAGVNVPYRMHKFRRAAAAHTPGAPAIARHYYFQLGQMSTGVEVIGAGVTSVRQQVTCMVQYPAKLLNVEDAMLFDAGQLKVRFEDTAYLSGEVQNIQAEVRKTAKTPQGTMLLPVDLTVVYRVRS